MTVESVTQAIEDLATRLDKEADGYTKQIEEARAKGLPHDCMLGTKTALRLAAKELHALVRSVRNLT